MTTSILPTITATSNPSVTNDRANGYHVGFRWLNTSTVLEYVCTNDTTGAAVWTSITSLGSLDLSLATGILASTKGGTGINNAGTITNASNTTITGGGTLALGGYTLTADATGTACLLGTIQTVTGAKTFSTTATTACAFVTTTGGNNCAITLESVDASAVVAFRVGGAEYWRFFGNSVSGAGNGAGFYNTVNTFTVFGHTLGTAAASYFYTGSTLDASSSTVAGNVLAGGLAVAKGQYIGTFLNVGSTIDAGGNITATAATNIAIGTVTTSTTGFSYGDFRNDVGAVLQAGTFGSARAATTFGASNANLSVIYTAQYGGTAPSGLAIGTISSIPVIFGSGGIARMTIAAGGDVAFSSATDSATKDTGSIVTEGGIGVEKAVVIGTTLTINGLTTGRVPYTSTSGLLVSSSTLVYTTASGLNANPSGTTSGTMFGINAGNSTMTGVQNTLIGTSAGENLTTGESSVFAGYRAGWNTTSSGWCVMIGALAGSEYNSSADYQTFVGGYAGHNVYGAANVAIGAQAMTGDSAGSGVSNSVAIGFLCFNQNSSGIDNVIIGSYAGNLLTAVSRTVAIGGNALYTGDSGCSDTVAVGYNALNLCTIAETVAVGSYACAALTTGTNNTAVGFKALYTSSIGLNNTAIGYQSLLLATGDHNTAVGYNVGASVTTGEENVLIGSQTGYALTTGSRNVIVGQFAGGATTTGDDNIFIGNYAGGQTPATASGHCVIGSDFSPITQVYIGGDQFSGTPTNTTINSGGGYGTDIAGASLTLAGGLNTGAGLGGSVIISTSDALASGTTLGTLTTRVTVDTTGRVSISSTEEATTTTDGSLTTLGGISFDIGKSLYGGGIFSKSPSMGIGYVAGAGGTVTQATNKSTGVTLNKVCGEITMHNANLAAATSVNFTLTNSVIGVDDVIILNMKSGGTVDSYDTHIESVASGSCVISLRNHTAGTLGEAVVLSFALIKAYTA